MKENGKAKDGFETVDGKATAKSPLLGLRVTGANVKEEKNGGNAATLTIAGRIRIDQKTVGQHVHVSTAANGRVFAGFCTEVAARAGKKEGERSYQAKVAGVRAHDLDEIVGMQVTIEQAQGELPIGGEASPDDATDELRALRPKGHELAVNPPQKKRGRGKGAEARG